MCLKKNENDSSQNGERDARAHVRIVRHFPRRKRIGPGLDFIGSSTLVLTVLPLVDFGFDFRIAIRIQSHHNGCLGLG